MIAVPPAPTFEKFVSSMIPRRRIELGSADLQDLMRGIGNDPDAVREFEISTSALLGGRPVRATASGRDALDLILDGLNITSGSEIVVPAYTLSELIVRMLRRGFRPKAADVDPNSFCVTPETMARAVTSRTRAAVVLHTFGAPCDIPAIHRVTAPRGIPLIEDCAHAFGAAIGGRPVGTFGHAALFSLEVAKPVATFGGGLLATDDEELLRKTAVILRQRKQTPWPAIRKAVMKSVEEMAVRSPAYALAARLMFRENESGGFERFYRGVHDRVRPMDVGFSSFQARRGLRQLKRLEFRNRHLNGLWNRLSELLPSRFAAQSREEIGEPVPYNFVARFKGDVRELRRRAQNLGLDLAIHGELLDDVSGMLGQSDCPGAAGVFSEAVAIPLHLGIYDRHVSRIGRVLEEACVS